jgi:hypothetical protein
MTHKISRNVDDGALTALELEVATLRAQPQPDPLSPFAPLLNVNLDDLIRRKPELATGKYRDLDAAQLAIFDRCLVIKPGMPSVELKPAKK